MSPITGNIRLQVGVTIFAFLATILCGLVARSRFQRNWEHPAVPLFLQATANNVRRENASLHVEEKRADFDTHRNCSKTLFKQYCRVSGYFPSGGKWLTVKHNGKNVPQFQPNVCHFQWPSTEALRQALPRHRSSHLLLMGSSQMKRYTGGVHSVLGQTGFKCKKMKREKQIDRTPDTRYFARGNMTLASMLQVRRHHCSGCTSSLYTCTASGSDINVEYIGMDDILDSTVRLYDPNGREHSVETYQEFIFRMFLKGHYPDILVVSPALNHLKFKYSPAKFAMDLDFFIGLMRLHLPQTTRVLWIPGSAENENAKRRVKNERYWNMRVEGMLASERIDLFNHILYANIEKELMNASSNIFGFLDLFQASMDRESWYTDGTHLQKAWYKTMAAYILELLYLHD